MTREELIAGIDEEIARMHEIRALLSGAAMNGHNAGGGVAVMHGISIRTAKPKKTRTLSPDARARIAAAQKRRWAKQKAAQNHK